MTPNYKLRRRLIGDGIMIVIVAAIMLAIIFVVGIVERLLER